MPRKKLEKYKGVENLENVIEPSKENYKNIKGGWSEFFENDNPIVLELACGYGEYTTNLAEVFPDKNFIGVDIKGDRIWKGANYAKENNLKNVGFLRTQIEQIENFFAKNEVSEIWITFPDPQLKKAKKRLTGDKYLDIYKKILKPGSTIHLKTDSEVLFNYTKKVLAKRSDIKNLEFTEDFYNSEFKEDSHGIQTRYEKKYLKQGIKIKYLKFEII